jgi:hypothetical protein
VLFSTAVNCLPLFGDPNLATGDFHPLKKKRYQNLNLAIGDGRRRPGKGHPRRRGLKICRGVRKATVKCRVARAFSEKPDFATACFAAALWI